MNNFTFHISTKIYFGQNQITSLSGELKKSNKILIVTGGGNVKKNGIFDLVINKIDKIGASYCELSGIKPNPRLKSVYQGIDICKRERIDFVLAVGGGSVIDAGKAIAAGAEYDGDVWDFFVKGIKCKKALPLGTILTLAATGSEMNRHAVITKEDAERKLAFSAECVKPVFSILDPEFTFSVNKYHTAAGIVDIITHIFEEYFSGPDTAFVQNRIAEALIQTCIRFGPVVCQKPKDYEARSNILWAGSLALNGLLGEGKFGDWACHAIEHEISAIYDISHGAGLSIIVPNWMRFVVDDKNAKKVAEYGINVWSIDKKIKDIDIAEEAIQRTRSFFSSLGMPERLKDVGIGNERFRDMAKRAILSHGTVGTFRKLSEEDIVKILEMSL